MNTKALIAAMLCAGCATVMAAALTSADAADQPTDKSNTIIWNQPAEKSTPEKHANVDTGKPTITQQQLDALLAPIALYPDQLLSQILMAATYPLEIVEAARWVDKPENQGLTGDRLAEELQSLDWDPSVKALVAFPQILKMMDRDLDWLSQIGDAFLAQETEVMDSVQRLRREAKDADKLNSDSRRSVTYDDDQIVIEPANPDIVYVPFYDPCEAYGVWPYPDYPPVYVTPPLGYTYSPGIFVTFGTVRPLWGWSRWDWRQRRIYITDVDRYTYYNRGHAPISRDTWRHDPRHRHGIERGGIDQNRFDRGDRFRGNRPATVNNGQPPISVTDQDIRQRYGDRRDGRGRGDNQDNNRAGSQGGRRGFSNNATPQLPNAIPELPQVNPVPAATPPVPAAEEPRRQWDRGEDRGNRSRDRDSSQDTRGRQQFQDLSNGAAPLTNVPPTQQQRWRDNSISAPPVTNVPPPEPPPQRFDRRRDRDDDSPRGFQRAPEPVQAAPEPVRIAPPPPPAPAIQQPQGIPNRATYGRPPAEATAPTPAPPPAANAPGTNGNVVCDRRGQCASR